MSSDLATPSRGRTSARRARRRGRHPGEAGDARAAHQAEQHRLGLIVGVAGGRDRVGADAFGMGEEKAVAGVAGPFLKAGRGPRARPDERRMRDSEPSQKAATPAASAALSGRKR